MRSAFPLFCGALLLALSSCSYELSPYTSHVQNEANLNAEQLRQVQFYLSDDIVLFRNLSNSETQIAGGEIKIVDGQKVEQIVIPSGTPGIVTSSDGDVLLVSFDEDGSVLRFGPNKDYGGRYTLMAKQWNGRTGIVDYAGKEFKTTPESIYAYLMINLKKIDNSTVETKNVSGRTIGSDNK